VRIEREASDTLTAVEMDVGDELAFGLADGPTRSIVVREAGAKPCETGPTPEGGPEGVVRYRIRATLEVDGHVVHLVRTIPSQESFSPPPRFLGLRVWLDAVDDIFTFLAENHGECRPRRKVRLAVWDARQRICPVLLHPWCPLPAGGLRVSDCYRGEDTWLGPYDGAECHGGLDVNHPAGTPLWTPLRIDAHEMFARITEGENNNRWRGTHRWPDGSTWVLQSHHVIRLLVPEEEPIAAGTHYAEAAGVLSGAHEHSHFVFRVREGDDEVMLDPWLLFWQMYEDRKLTSAD
jgi:hypothetical protein